MDTSALLIKSLKANRAVSELADKYEVVVGLEVHAQLLTKSKMYASDLNAYGTAPNTNVSVLTLGHPGTLPVVNKSAIEYAIRLGIALDCDIHRDMFFARKNYFYADLPKGYQITQDNTPICTGGQVFILDGEGNEKQINITRIHMEEDAGKSIHDQDPVDTLIDLNRAGVPLVEIVSEPELRSGEEAYNYLNEVRRILRYLEICDGNMEEGSMRCDANISVRLKGAEEFGTRTEVKNMNSMRNVQKAIAFETKRQIEVIEDGGKILQETMNFDAVTGKTYSMREKASAHDYRYFPEPDLQPVVLSEEQIEKVRSAMPALPRQLFEKYTTELGLSAYDARVIIEHKATADYFEKIISHTENAKAAVNWLTGDIRSYLNQNAKKLEELKLEPERVAGLIELIDQGTISYSVAAQKLFPLLLESSDTAQELAEQHDLLHEENDDIIHEIMKEIMDKFPEKVAAYRAGNKGLLGLFMGEVMRNSKGKADPKKANKIVKTILEEA